MWIYNPGSNSWRAGPPYSVDHQGPGAALFNGRGFAVGGGAASGGSAAVESVGPCGPTPTATANVEPDSTISTYGNVYANSDPDSSGHSYTYGASYGYTYS